MRDERTVADLRAILRKFLVEDFLGNKRWPGMEWAKAGFGNMCLGALESHGCDRREELQVALVDAKKTMKVTT